ncbi:alpha/beta fold hydrolase [Cupriavidus necator]
MPFAKINGIDWYYVEKGRGPLLLFCHSTFVDHRLFDELVDVLSAQYRCVALDWPGHGKSGWNADGWTMDDLVNDVPRFISALGETSAVLAGVSVGAAVALRVALAYPKVVRGLIYMSARADPNGPEAAQRMHAMACELRDGTDAQRRAIFTSAPLETLMHYPGWREAHPERAARELQIQLEVPRNALPLIAGVLATMGPTSARLHEIRCPLLSLFGAHDPGVEWAEIVGQGVASGRTRVVPDAGHHLPFDAPSETLDVIRDFLSDSRL